MLIMRSRLRSLGRSGRRWRWRGSAKGCGAAAGIAPRLRLPRGVGLPSLALVYGIGLWLMAPWFDRRGVEWAFYESIGRLLPATMPLTFLYDDWDRLPYEGPFGSIPHDLAVRLFYLGRPACWHIGTESLLAGDHCTGCCSSASFHPIVAPILPAPSIARSR